MPSLRSSSKRDSSNGLDQESESFTSTTSTSPASNDLKSTTSKQNSSPISPSSSPKSSSSPSTITSKGLPTVELNGHPHPGQLRDEDGTDVFSGYEAAKRDMTAMNGLILNGNGHLNGIMNENGTGNEEDETEGDSPTASLIAPSMTTGSTSASRDSLESIQASHDQAVQSKISRSLASNEKEAQLQPLAQIIPPKTSHSSSSDGTTLLHQEYGYCSNQFYRYTSQHRVGDPLPHPFEEEPSYFILISTYLTYLILIVVGHARDFFEKRMFPASFDHLVERNGYAALNSDFDSFYTRRLKLRIDDLFARPVTGVCGRTVVTLDRTSDDYFHSFKLTGEKTRALNVSAYNYLGFAQSHGGCADSVEIGIQKYGVSSFSSRLGAGHLDLHHQTEKLVAKFVGKEDAVIISMGFATNSTTIPVLSGPGTLLISDEYNHSSLRFGSRLSGAMIRQYKHNDMESLEKLLKECISQGMPRTHRPWKKIVLLVEGLYSMEGTLINLPAVMDLKEKYKVSLGVATELSQEGSAEWLESGLRMRAGTKERRI